MRRVTSVTSLDGGVVAKIINERLRAAMADRNAPNIPHRIKVKSVTTTECRECEHDKWDHLELDEDEGEGSGWGSCEMKYCECPKFVARVYEMPLDG